MDTPATSWKRPASSLLNVVATRDYLKFNAKARQPTASVGASLRLALGDAPRLAGAWSPPPTDNDFMPAEGRA